MRSVVMPRIAYAGQGANLSEAHIKRPDSVTLAYSKGDLRPLAGFPKAPMIHYQFINYPLPSSIRYDARLGSVWQNLGREGRPAEILCEHLESALRTRGSDPSMAQPLRIKDSYCVCFFIKISNCFYQLTKETTGSIGSYKGYMALVCTCAQLKNNIHQLLPRDASGTDLI